MLHGEFFFLILQGDSGGPLMVITGSTTQSYSVVGKVKFVKVHLHI